MQFHQSYISTVQHFKRPFLINKVQYSSPDSPCSVLREGIKCYGSWNSWNHNFPILSAALFWGSRGCDQQNACSREGYSWQGGTVAKWHFGCSCFHLSLGDHGSARFLPEPIPCTHKSPLLPPRSTVSSMRWELVFAFQHPRQLLSSWYLSRWKQDCMCCIFTKELPLPHVLAVHAPNMWAPQDTWVKLRGSKQQHTVKQQIYWPSGRADRGKKKKNIMWAGQGSWWHGLWSLVRDDSVSATWVAPLQAHHGKGNYFWFCQLEVDGTPTSKSHSSLCHTQDKLVGTL